MAMIVGVSIKQGTKIISYDADYLVLKLGDEVIVPTDKGIEFGRVAEASREIPDDKMPEGIRKVIRRATDRDRQQQERNKVRREEAYKKCLELIEKNQLPMKLVDVDYAFDGNSITFYFTADGRVDFRDLVKDLASALRTRIELRQIGVRDEAKIIGGLGPCGRPLCCSLFLRQFDPVSIRMAKEQYLPLNPTKISGVCGRLMCCLRYEYEVYRRFNRRAPQVGQRLKYQGCELTVTGYDVVRESVVAQDDLGKKFYIHIDFFGEEPAELEPVDEMEDLVEEDLSEEELDELSEE